MSQIARLVFLPREAIKNFPFEYQRENSISSFLMPHQTISGFARLIRLFSAAMRDVSFLSSYPYWISQNVEQG